MSFYSPEINIFTAGLTFPVATFTNAIKLSGELVFDGIGSGGFSIPANTVGISALQSGRYALGTLSSTEVGASSGEIFLIIIKAINRRVTATGIVFDVSGPDILHELSQATIGNDVIDNGSDGIAVNDVQQVLNYAPVWSTTQNNSSTGSYIVGNKETVIEGLRLIVAQSNNHFRVTDLNPPTRGIEWLYTPDRFQDGSGNDVVLKGIDPADPLADDGDPNVGLIFSITENEDSYDLVTRVYAYGAGMGEDQVSMNDATMTPDSGYSIQPSNSLFINDAAELTYGVIERYQQFPNIRAANDTPAALEAAANALAFAAQVYLYNRRSPDKIFTIRCKTYRNPKPYQWVAVDYTQVVAGVTVYSLVQDVLIHTVSHEVGENGQRITVLKCSTEEKTVITDGLATMKIAERQDSLIRHTSAPATAAGSSAPTDHDTLTNRTNPDNHSQYLLAAGGRTLTGNLPVTVGITIDGVDISEANAAQYLVLSATGELPNERVFSLGFGLSGADSGAGAAYTVAVNSSSNPGTAERVLQTSVGGLLQLIGLGINTAGTAGRLNLAGNLAFSGGIRSITTDSTNDLVLAPGGDILLQQTGGGAASIKTDGGNDLNLDAAGNVTITPAGAQATIVGDLALTGASRSITTDSTNNLILAPGGDVILNPTGKDILPNTGYDLNIGALAKKYLTLHVAELWAETLVAQNTIATIGGRILVVPTTVFEVDVSTGDTTLSVKHNQMDVGDVAYSEANLKVEFFSIGSLAIVAVDTGLDRFTISGNYTAYLPPSTIFRVSGSTGNDGTYTVSTVQFTGGQTRINVVEEIPSAVVNGGIVWAGGGPYVYLSVTRNLDGTGANEWYAGDAIVNLGQAGNGFIDLYSLSGLDGNGIGPTIVGNVRNSSTFNDWNEAWAIGNLNGLYGYGVDTYGVGLGKYAAGASHLTIDPTNGIRMYSGLSTIVGEWQPGGDITLGEVATDNANIFWDQSTGIWYFRGGTSGTQTGVSIDSDGAITLQEGTNPGGGAYSATPRTAINFRTSGGNPIGKIFAWQESSGGVGRLALYTESPNAPGVLANQAKIVLAGSNGTTGVLVGGDVIQIDPNDYLLLTSGGLAVGFSGLIPADGDIYVANDIRVNGGIFVGAALGQNPDANDIHYAGNLKSYKGATNHDVYGRHDLTGPVFGSGWSGAAKAAATIYTINIASVFPSIPANAVALHVGFAMNTAGAGRMRCGYSNSNPIHIEFEAKAAGYTRFNGTTPINGGNIYFLSDVAVTNAYISISAYYI